MNYGGNNLLFYFEAVFPPLSVKVQGILFKYLVVLIPRYNQFRKISNLPVAIHTFI